MRREAVTAASLILFGVAAVCFSPPPARAADAALNGRFQVTSNGQWATTNDVYRDEAVVRSIWTIVMTCSNALTCYGTVTSDAGWTAEISTTNGEYNVARTLLGWETCADGSGRTVTGHQLLQFFPVDGTGQLLPGSSVFGGFDKTSGESGGCSLNEKLEIDMPFRLERLQ